MTRGIAAWLALAAILTLGELSGFTTQVIDGAGDLGISTAHSIQEEVGGMVNSRAGTIEDLTNEIDALG